MKYKRNLFISFEGPEASGKSSQLRLLSKYFRLKNIPHLITREPGGTLNAEKLIKEGFNNCGSICDEKIKSQILMSSIFAVSKSGTISLEICNAKVPSIIIYKINSINFFIVKMLVKVKFANIINIAADEEVIPELLQSNCNSKNIFDTVDMLFEDKQSLKKQVDKTQKIITNFKTYQSSEIAVSVLTNSL